MAAYNPNISNGTCYYTVNKETKGNFIPCGNNAIQVWPCCQLGSMCLSLGDANACYDAKSGNAYVAGCTDPSFVSPNCLYKKEKFKDQEWVGISQACTGLNVNSNPSGTKWTGCIVDQRSTELVKLPLSNCTGSCVEEDVIYVGPTSLAAYASLPTIAGSSIFWQSNYVPPSTPAVGYTPGTTTPVVGTARPTASGGSASSGGSGGLSTGAKAGIGAGAAVGGIILIAIIVSLIMWMRRKKKQQQYAPPSDPNNHLNHNNNNASHNPPPATASGYPSSAGFHQSQYSQDMTMYPPSSIGHPSPPIPYNATFFHQNMGTPTGYSDSPHPHTHHQGGSNMGFKSELPAEDVAPIYKPPLSPATTVLGAGSPPPGSTRGEVAPKYSEGRGW